MSPPTEPTSTASIDDLPVEMICELFKYLAPKDLAACSLVNKRWYSIYSNFKLHSLVVDHSRFSYLHQTIPEVSWAVFRRLVEKPLLLNLKHLDLCCYESDFDLNELNRFQRLVHLKIDTIHSNKKANLNLPRLEVLVFPLFNWGCALSLDCPQLSTLNYLGECEGANLLEVKHPETIRMLKTTMAGSQLVPFKSVEYLVTEEYQVVSTATLRSMPKLRELRYIRDIEKVFEDESHNGTGTADRVKRALSEFVDEAKLRGNDFRFRFAGLQLTNVNVDQIDFDVQIDERTEKERVYNGCFYMKYYHLIGPDAIDFVFDVNYTHLLSHMTGEFPRCFSQKFTNIKDVSVSAKVQDVDHFLWFLKSLRPLRSLELAKTGLGQEFYDQLPASVSSLDWLYLRDGHCNDELQLSFDFVSEFSDLACLNIMSGVYSESLPSLARSLGKVRGFSFDVRLREEEFRIKKKTHLTEWTINKADQLLFKSENPDEIVNFIERLQD